MDHLDEWASELQVFCVDVGSIAQGNFAWARRHPAEGEEEVHDPASISSLTAALEFHLSRDRPVALGFEMPLFLPVPLDWRRLGKARPVDAGAPSWSQSAAASATATGAVQAAWILHRLRERAADARLFLRWDRFVAEKSGLLLWEAFVTGAAKGATHEDDAQIGVQAFCTQLPEPGKGVGNQIERPFSLAAALALWAGWDLPVAWLTEPGIVVRAGA